MDDQGRKQPQDQLERHRNNGKAEGVDQGLVKTGIGQKFEVIGQPHPALIQPGELDDFLLKGKPEGVEQGIDGHHGNEAQGREYQEITVAPFPGLEINHGRLPFGLKRWRTWRI